LRDVVARVIRDFAHLAFAIARGRTTSQRVLKQYSTEVIGRHCFLPARLPFDTCLSIDHTGRLGRSRYFYLIARFLSSEDYPIGILMRRPYLVSFRTYLRSMDPYARLAFKHEHAQFIYLVPSEAARMTLIHDGSDSRLIDYKWRKIITLDEDIAAIPNKTELSILMPYPMHPLIYAANPSIEPLRHSNKSIRLFFSGNANPQIYREEWNLICKRFRMLNRVEVIDAVLGLPDHLVWRLNSQGELTQVLSQKCLDRVVLALSDDGVGVEQSGWLKTLSRCDVFLAPPGVFMPQCHNIIEAMAVGCIPLTNYADWFSPPLVDGVNCFRFHGGKELQERIASILATDQAALNAMRQRVVEYYDRHLAPKGFLERLRAHTGSQIRLYVNTERDDILKRVHKGSALRNVPTF
jgi:glycosyltransferase involved in cell wall biosynthesis